MSPHVSFWDGRLDVSAALPLKGCVMYKTLCASALAPHIVAMWIRGIMGVNALSF